MSQPIVNIKFLADLRQFSSQMQNVDRRLKKVSRKFTNVGTNLTVGLTTPLVGFGAAAVKAAADFEKLGVSLNTVFKGNEAAASAAFDQITQFTAKTPFQLEEVAGAFIKLKNLGLDPSMEALRAYGNTASALGKTLDQFVEAVADAVVGEFERLKEFGIKARSEGENVAFTFQGLTTTVGKNAEEIETYLRQIGNVNFAGGIEKQAGTFYGRLSTLKDNLKLLFADFGQILLGAIGPIFDKLGPIIQKFRDLSPATKKFIVVLGGVAAAVGPLLALAGTILPAIATGFSILAGPVGAILAGLTAIGVVIYKNWQPIKQTLVDIANYFVDLYNESLAFRIITETIVTAFKNIYRVGQFVFTTIGNVFKLLIEQVKTGFGNLGDIIRAIFTGNFEALPGLIAQSVSDSFDNLTGFVAESRKEFKLLADDINTNISEGINNALNGRKYHISAESVDTDAVQNKVAGAVEAGAAGQRAGGPSGGGDPTPPVTKAAAVSPAGLASPGPTASPLLTNQRFFTDAELNMASFQGKLTEFNETSGSLMQGVAENFVGGFADVVAGIATGAVGFGAVGGLLLKTLANLTQQLGRAAVKIGLTMKAIKLSFSNPFAAIAAGLGLLVISGVLRSLAGNFGGGGQQPQGFADGGVVGGTSFYGDKILARVNSGELILNKNQQRNLYGMISQQAPVVVGGEIDVHGTKLKVLLNRVEKKLGRNG